MLNPPAPPEAKASAGLKQEPHRFPSILAAACVGRGALGVVVVVVACLLTLICVQCHLEALRVELSQLREELLSKMHRDGGTPQGGGDSPEPWALKKRPLERRTRDVRKTAQEPSSRQRKKRSVLHLVPVRQSSSSDGEVTEIWWETFLHQGRALEPQGQDVLVKHTGLYFIYSQVLFHDNTFTMGQELRRLVPGAPDQTLFRCVQSMPAKPEQAYNSCYSGGVFHLKHGDRVSLRIPRFNASFVVSPHGTFLGLLRL